MIIFNSSLGSASANTINWSTWDETEQDYSNAFIIDGKDANNANAVGLGGGLALADRTWTQNGTIDGNGTYRTLDGATEWFSVTTTFMNFLTGYSSWGIVFKLENWTQVTAYESIIRWANDKLIIRTNDATKKLEVAANGTVLASTVSTMAVNTVLYIYFGCNGSDTRCGFVSTRPTKWSDFAVGSRVSHGSAITIVNHTELAPEVFRDSVGNNRYATTRFHYAVAAYDTALIDFNS